MKCLTRYVKGITVQGLGVLIILTSLCNGELERLPDSVIKINRLSDKVREVLEHYKSPDPKGIPGFKIPDPMELPVMKKELGWRTYLTLSNQTIHGLSKLNLESAYSNVADMQMFMALRVDFLQVLGNYSSTFFFSEAHGASNTTFTDLYVEGIAKLKVAKEGYLEATDIELDISVSDIDVYFENPGFLGSILQAAMNSAGSLIIDAIKPYILRLFNSQILDNTNQNLRELKMTFPNSLSPLDVCIAQARKIVRQKGFDPFKVDDFIHTTGVMGLEVTQIWISGTSSFYRVGNITVEIENNTVYIGISAGTKELKGSCNWDISMASLLSTNGKISFDIEYLEGVIRVNQSLDTRKRPNLESLQISLGNFQVQFDGAGTLDYIIEAGVNILPNLLRNHIMLAIEEPLKIKIQEIFNEIDVEKEIYKNVEEFEKMSANINLTNNTTKAYPHEEGLTVDDSQLDDSIF